jgi:hypothetical protein
VRTGTGGRLQGKGSLRPTYWDGWGTHSRRGCQQDEAEQRQECPSRAVTSGPRPQNPTRPEAGTHHRYAEQIPPSLQGRSGGPVVRKGIIGHTSRSPWCTGPSIPRMPPAPPVLLARPTACPLVSIAETSVPHRRSIPEANGPAGVWRSMGLNPATKGRWRSHRPFSTIYRPFTGGSHRTGREPSSPRRTPGGRTGRRPM